jgi:hypothetical protein
MGHADSASCNPILSTQPWDQYVGELFDSDNLPYQVTQGYDGANTYESLEHTNDQIEQWAIGNDEAFQITTERARPEEPYICYGTVSA